jgi:nucleotide-binding universal stress UspA family protein
MAETETTQEKGGRRGDGGTYMIVADQTDEFEVAKNYACSLAKTRRGHVTIMHVTELEDFVHWGKVEAMMRHDMRQAAEEEIWTIAKSIYEEFNIIPSFNIHEGKTVDAIVNAIDDDKHIRSLVLAASQSGNGPGPLVTYFTGKGIERLRVPMVIVPGHLDKEDIQSITRYNPHKYEG